MDPNGSPKPSKLILVSTKEHPALPNRAYPGSPSHNLGDMDPDSDIMVAQKNNVSRLLKGKEKEWTAVLAKERPLQLLDLPLDILKEIFKEVSGYHTGCMPCMLTGCQGPEYK